MRGFLAKTQKGIWAAEEWVGYLCRLTLALNRLTVAR